MSCWSCRFSCGCRRRRGCCGLHNRRRHVSLWRSRWSGWPHPRGFRRSFLRFLLRFGGRFCLRFGFRDSLNFSPDLLRNVNRNRARMRLFLRDTETGQKVNDRLGLHFQFACQLVDSDLVRVSHALRSLRGSLFLETLLLRVTPALPLPLALLRFRFLLPKLRLVLLPPALSPLQQGLPFPQKLPPQPVLLRQVP